MRVTRVRPAARCAVCHDALVDRVVGCAACDAQGHADCWADLGRCTSIGCASVPSVVARPAVPKHVGARASRLAIVGVVGALGLVAAVVAVNLSGRSGCGPRCRVPKDMKAIGDAPFIPYLKDYPPKDPWGNVYVYRYERGRRFEIVSYGADGTPGCSCLDCDLSSRTINER